MQREKNQKKEEKGNTKANLSYAYGRKMAKVAYFEGGTKETGICQ